MATETKITLEDDLSGGPAVTTVHFAVDGTAYEIDLNLKNAEKLEKALAPFVGKARRVGRVTPATRGARRAGKAPRLSVVKDAETAPSTSAVRAWAQAHGHKVSDKGRVPKAITALFVEAGN